MKKYILLILIIFWGLEDLSATQLSDFQLKNLNNQMVQFSEIKGEKITVLDFWATWCKPCVRSIPKLVELYEKYSDQGVQFVGINVDGIRNLAKVRPFSRSLGINYPVLLDVNNQLRGELDISAIPYLVIVDGNNEIIYTHQGYRPGDEKIVEQEIQKLLQGEWEKEK